MYKLKSLWINRESNQSIVNQFTKIMKKWEVMRYAENNRRGLNSIHKKNQRQLYLVYLPREPSGWGKIMSKHRPNHNGII